MKIESARFVKGVLGSNSILKDGIPQVAFIGRSNVGKSSVINSLVNRNDLARTSSFPGRTQQINLFLINNSLYFVDLPGYGYAKLPDELKNSLRAMVNWYFFISNYKQKKVVLIIDANKIDKIKKAGYEEQLKTIKNLVGVHQIIPYSAKNKLGVEELLKEIL